VVSPITNVIIATNTLVRLKLYEYLEKIVVDYEYLEKADRRVLYYDTDSYIYLSTSNPNE